MRYDLWYLEADKPFNKLRLFMNAADDLFY